VQHIGARPSRSQIERVGAAARDISHALGGDAARDAARRPGARPGTRRYAAAAAA